MEKHIASPLEIAKEVHKDLTTVKGLTLASVARRIGKTPQSLYNILSGNRRISCNVAVLLNKEFGYSIPFLTEGAGSLYNTISTSSFNEWKALYDLACKEIDTLQDLVNEKNQEIQNLRKMLSRTE